MQTRNHKSVESDKFFFSYINDKGKQETDWVYMGNKEIDEIIKHVTTFLKKSITFLRIEKKYHNQEENKEKNILKKKNNNQDGDVFYNGIGRYQNYSSIH